jgi:2-polyprenyl-3-methyl-5-hydroxy-6-metoxy-1,4-benzoquinol methylase
MNCPICESADASHFIDSRDYITGEMFANYRCARCGFVFVWPVPADLSPYYPSFYRQYGPVVLGLFRVAQELRVAGWARRLGRGGGRVLEVGCGHGWMLNALRRRGWRVAGIERAVESARFARQQLGIPMLVGDLNGLRPAPVFDLIVLHEVLEHLPRPMETLHACARLLKPGGSLMLEVPNLDSWQFAFVREHWEHLNTPRHLGHFTPDSLGHALARAGLRIAHISFVSLEYDPYSWVQGTLNKLGFPQNMLLRGLAAGGRRQLLTPTGLWMLVCAALLLAPGFVVAGLSWLAGKGSIMEVRAVREANPSDAAP